MGLACSVHGKEVRNSNTNSRELECKGLTSYRSESYVALDIKNLICEGAERIDRYSW